MISIKGASGQEMVIATEQKGGYRWTYVASAGHYKTADLLAALNAVPESKLFEAGEAYAKQAEELRAALDPEPAFVLPTEVPARIIAVKSSTGDGKELTLFTDGDTTWWADIEDWGPFWTRSQVMDQFTGHRLLDDAE